MLSIVIALLTASGALSVNKGKLDIPLAELAEGKPELLFNKQVLDVPLVLKEGSSQIKLVGSEGARFAVFCKDFDCQDALLRGIFSASINEFHIKKDDGKAQLNYALDDFLSQSMEQILSPIPWERFINQVPPNLAKAEALIASRSLRGAYQELIAPMGNKRLEPWANIRAQDVMVQARLSKQHCEDYQQLFKSNFPHTVGQMARLRSYQLGCSERIVELKWAECLARQNRDDAIGHWYRQACLWVLWHPANPNYVDQIVFDLLAEVDREVWFNWFLVRLASLDPLERLNFSIKAGKLTHLFEYEYKWVLPWWNDALCQLGLRESDLIFPLQVDGNYKSGRKVTTMPRNDKYKFPYSCKVSEDVFKPQKQAFYDSYGERLKALEMGIFAVNSELERFFQQKEQL